MIPRRRRRRRWRSTTTVAERLAAALGAVLGVDRLPVRLRAWDGIEAGPGRTRRVVVVRSPQALRRLLWAPGELGLARAYVAGDIDIEGDVFATVRRAELDRPADAGASPPAPVRAPSGWRWLRTGAARWASSGRSRAPPPEEVRRPPVRPPAQPAPRRRRHRPPLRRRQRLLRAGARPVDGLLLRLLGRRRHVGAGGRAGGQARPGLPQARACARACGCSTSAAAGAAWRIHAAREYGADGRRHHAVAGAGRAAPASGSPRPGLTDRVEIRVQDYRDVDDGPFDAISSIGMAEHVGPRAAARLRRRTCTRLLRPGGRLLNHAIAWHAGADDRGRPDTFIDRYVFPDGELLSLGTMVGRAGGRRASRCATSRRCGEHYALTLRAWVRQPGGALGRGRGR